MRSTNFICAVIILIGLVATSGAKKVPLSRIRIRGKWFVDDLDRVTMLRGTNAVCKKFPWVPDSIENDMTNLTQVSNLKRWGFNVVRLGLMWSGVMPVRDVINQTYLTEMVNIVDMLGQNDIYVIVDLHQDMLSTKFDSYDGVPLWLLNLMPSSRSNFPWPLNYDAMNASIFAAYITESCGFAFQCLYDNRNSFADYFELYWAVVANALAGRTNVLAYELLNEPWAGDVYANPFLLLPGVAGQFNLMPLYDRAYRAIRRYDNETLVFYEPVTWGVLLNLNYFGTGFTRPPGNDPHRTALSWHYYCWLLQFAKNPLHNGTYPQFDRIFCDSIQLKACFDSVRFDALMLGGGPTFLTEFGVCAFPVDPDDERHSRYNTEECEHILDAADRYLQPGWTYWDSNFYDNVTLETRWEIVNAFSRVYPVAINGVPTMIYFNTTTKEFLFKFKMNVSSASQAKIPTEISVPPQIYEPYGFEVRLSPNLSWWFDKTSNKVLVILIEQVVERFYHDSHFSFHQEMIVSISSILL